MSLIMYRITMLQDIKKLSDFVRAKLGLPASKEPLPDLMEMQEPNREVGDVLYKPLHPTPDPYEDFVSIPTLSGWTSYKFTYTHSAPPTQVVPTDTEPFETNMMEALVGWRAWKLDLKKMALRSQNNFFADDENNLLRPGIPMVAKCGKTSGNSLGRASLFDPAGALPAPSVHAVPAEFCTCGIYAKDTLDEVIENKYDGIYGQVYGWGRYVRGDQGWRAQYMYPKRFYLTRNFAREISPDTIDFLRTYHVPIYVEQPTLLYNPEEDGYEHRSNEENWNFGADSNANPEED